jgi:hypothetical protein
MTITVNIDDPPYNAVGDGVTDDGPAFLDFQADYQGETDAVVLNLRNGGVYANAGAHGFCHGIPNLTINMEGATIKEFAMSGMFYQVAGKSARLSSAQQGSFTVTLSTAAETSFFTVGDLVCVSALDMQGDFGYPPNWIYLKYHRIASIGTGTLTFETSLDQTYKTTFPATSSGAYDTGGPATVFLVRPENDQILTINGGVGRGTLRCSFTQLQISAREFYLSDLDLDGFSGSDNGIAPTMAQIGRLTRCTGIGSFPSIEADKDMESYEMVDCAFPGDTIQFQSASLLSASIQGGSCQRIVGLPKRLSLSGGGSCDLLRMSSGGYGQNEFLGVSDFTVSGIEFAPTSNWMDLTGLETNYAQYMGNGLFKVDNESTAYGFAIPSAVGFFTGTGGGGPLYWGHMFEILDVWSTGGSIYFTTTLTLPALPTYSGTPGLTLTKLVLHPGQSVSFENVTGCMEVEALSLAPSGARAFSYFERQYAGSVGSVGVTPLTSTMLSGLGMLVFGKLVYIDVNVTKAFTGTGSPLLKLGQDGMPLWTEDDVWVRNEQSIDLKTVGRRRLTPGVVTGSVGSDVLSGFDAGDQAQGQIQTYISTDFSGQSEALWPEFTITIQTDQNIEIANEVLLGQACL